MGKQCDRCGEPIKDEWVEPDLCEVCKDDYRHQIKKIVEHILQRPWEDLKEIDRNKEIYYIYITAVEWVEENFKKMMERIENDNSKPTA